MKDNRYFAVLFMFVLTMVLSTILIGLERLTRQRIKANNQIAFEQAVVTVFPDIQVKSTIEIHSVFSANFVLAETSGGAYEYRPNGQLAGYALPFEGQGFWSPIKGVVGIAIDKKTITGVWFYEQAETPGLGARIVEPAFYGQFAGKVLEPGEKPIRIRPVLEAQPQDIHAITGATQTCIRVERLFNETVIQWRNRMEKGGRE